MEIIIGDHKQDNVDHNLHNTASGLEERGKLDDKKQPAQNDCKKGLLVRHNQSDQSCDDLENIHRVNRHDPCKGRFQRRF